MPPRSPVRTNIVIFTILGFVVALLIHFVVLSSVRYNWFDSLTPAGAPGALLLNYLGVLLGF
ncbi:light-harvesting protein [Candidatus Oscillochloris fontis]|uniref:light-harvesting protein n=1 Tax=Candidatus Oscillochloris fontis TaxID=2496868 RepID=UPI00101D18E5|nr:light-harvesting protein [Candidatus Oscillochloris fontis]